MTLTTPRLQLLTVAQAAALLNVSDRTIRRWIEAKKVPYLKLPSGGYRIPQASLLASHVPEHITYRIITEANCPVLTMAFASHATSVHAGARR